MKKLSIMSLLRYGLGICLILAGISCFAQANVAQGLICVLCGAACLPIVYERLHLNQTALQLFAPTFFLVLLMFSVAILDAIPDMPTTVIGTSYNTRTTATTTSAATPITAVTTTSAKTTATSFAVTTAPTVTETVAPSTVATTRSQSAVIETTAAVPITTTLETYAPVTSVQTTTVSAQTQQDTPIGSLVYRTPSGKRYHLSATCGGKNSYQVTYEQAVDAGLTPCKKCAQ